MKGRALSTTTDPIVRAFELARDSNCRNASEIRDTLKREGFANVERHFCGKALSDQLNKRIKARLLQGNT